jgi:hypothetical protein
VSCASPRLPAFALCLLFSHLFDFFPFGGRCLIVYLIVFGAPMVNVFDFTRDLV